MSTRSSQTRRKKTHSITHIYLVFPITCLITGGILVLLGTMMESDAAMQIGGGAIGMGGTAYQISRQEEESESLNPTLSPKPPDENL